jgi:hypothetical protein
MNGRFVRILPVHALCSERRFIADRYLVIYAAKVPEEPFWANAASLANACSC